MPTPHRRLAAALLALAAAPLAACANPLPTPMEIGIGYDQPGLALQVGYEHVGLDTALGRHVARDLGTTGREDLDFTPAPERSRAASVADGAVRLALGTADVAGTRRDDVTAVGPYLISGLGLATRAGSPRPAPADLRGKRVCVTESTSAERRLGSVVPGAVAVPVPTISTCLSAVVDGSADAALEDWTALRGYRAGPAYASLQVSAEPLTRDERVVLVPRKDEQLCRTVTASLRSMISSGAWADAVRGDLVTTGILDAVPPAPTVRGCD